MRKDTPSRQFDVASTVEATIRHLRDLESEIEAARKQIRSAPARPRWQTIRRLAERFQTRRHSRSASRPRSGLSRPLPEIPAFVTSLSGLLEKVQRRVKRIREVRGTSPKRKSRTRRARN